MHVGIAHPRWWRKRSRHSRRMRKPQFYVSGKRPKESKFWLLTLSTHGSLQCVTNSNSANEMFNMKNTHTVLRENFLVERPRVNTTNFGLSHLKVIVPKFGIHFRSPMNILFQYMIWRPSQNHGMIQNVDVSFVTSSWINGSELIALCLHISTFYMIYALCGFILWRIRKINVSRIDILSI